MRSLSTALSTALGAPVQRPALLVQIDFATPRRWTSGATFAWNGHTWTAAPIALDGLSVEALRISGTLVVGNHDDTIGGLILSEGIQDRAVTIYGYDAAATATGDVVWLASAVGASAEITETEARIALRHKAEFTVSPRTFATDAAGFGYMLPAGTVLRIAGIDYKLERR